MIRLSRHSGVSAPPTRLEGKNVYLRAPQPSDWAAWSELRESSRDFLVPWEPLWPEDALSETAYLRRIRRLATEWRSDEAYSFHIFGRESGQLVGGIGLTQIRRGVSQTGTVGYWIGQRYQGRGFMTAAVCLIAEFAFGALQLHRIEAACLPENTASRRVLEKSNFKREGYARLYLQIAGVWRDHLTFARLREDSPDVAPCQA